MLNKDACYLKEHARLMLERLVVEYNLDKDLALEIIVALLPEKEVWAMESEETCDDGSA